MTTVAPADRPTSADRLVTARYRGRTLSLSGPFRIYPSGLWYFRSSDSDDAPTWIPAAHVSGPVHPADPVPATGTGRATVTARDRIGAVAFPALATGLGVVGGACARLSAAFRATFVPHTRDE